MEDTPESRNAASYFFPIIAVIGGSLLMPPFTVFFTTIGPLALLVLTPVLLIGYTRYKQSRRRNITPRSR
ncbi:MAG: hypothetical protein E6I93_03545 [Chloroflexi bacterium]|nr:MAG: hypothetical protein E6I93_03545 [Chloroflexota bacterium]